MADFASLVRAIRILLTAALEFGRTTFPEFAGLNRADKVCKNSYSIFEKNGFQWKLALNFFYNFRMFEGCYRTYKIFSHNSNKYVFYYSYYKNILQNSRFFVTFGMYLTFPLDKKFFDSAPTGANIAGAFQWGIANLVHTSIHFLGSWKRAIFRRCSKTQEILWQK